MIRASNELLLPKTTKETDLEQQNLILKFYDNFNFSWDWSHRKRRDKEKQEISFPIQEKLRYFFLVIFVSSSPAEEKIIKLTEKNVAREIIEANKNCFKDTDRFLARL